MRLKKKKGHDSVLNVIYYNNCIDFWYPYKIKAINKVRLNEIHSKVSTCKLCLVHLLLRMVKRRGCFIITAFQLWFRICQQEGQKFLKLNSTYQVLIYADDVHV